MLGKDIRQGTRYLVDDGGEFITAVDIVSGVGYQLNSLPNPVREHYHNLGMSEKQINRLLSDDR